jgi:uncharacterized protein (TIGR00251 family)
LISDGTFYRWQNGDLLLFCHLQPQASRDEFAGTIAGSADIHVERLKIRITAPPVDGRANIQLIAFLAKQFGTTSETAGRVVDCATSGDSLDCCLPKIDNTRCRKTSLQIPSAWSLRAHNISPSRSRSRADANCAATTSFMKRMAN